MGQAKFRKNNDPLYGKPLSSVRGLIITSPIEVKGNSITFKGGGLDKQDLRSSLLYWDRLSWPDIGFIKIANIQDEDFLSSAGILDRPKLPPKIRSGLVSEIFKDVQLIGLDYYEKTEPGKWSIGNSVNSVLIEGGADPEMSGSLLQLYQSLPVPSPDIPLAEILEFKQKRRAELLALRSHLDVLTEEIMTAADSASELHKKIEQVDMACSDLINVTREWQFPVYLANLNVSLDLNLSKAISEGASAYTAVESVGLGTTTATVSAIAAGVQSQVKLTSDISLRSIKKSQSPYRYAYLAQRQLT